MNITYWLLPLLFGLCSSLASSVFATEFVPDTWYFESFPDNEVVFLEGYNRGTQLSNFCERYGSSAGGITDLTSYPADQWNTALGHTLSVLSDRSFIEPTQGQCVYFETETVLTDTPKSVYLYVRQIQECTDPDEEWSKEEHSCVPKPSACQEGVTALRSGISSPLIFSGGQYYVVDQTGPTTCINNCVYNKPSESHSCFSDSPLTSNNMEGGQYEATTKGHCNYNFIGTIQTCVSNASNTLPQPWGGYSLTSSSDPTTGFECAEGITSPGCPDGSGTGGGSTGGGSTGGGTGDGSTGGGTGDGSTGGGTGDGSTGGDGTGTDPSTVAGEACDSQIACTGDAIQCAILRQQKAQKCLMENLNDFEAGLAEVTQAVEGTEYQLSEETVDVTGLFSTGTRFLPSACPAPQQLYIASIGSSVSLSWEPMCQFAQAISFIVVAMASLFFVIYVGRSFGGE